MIAHDCLWSPIYFWITLGFVLGSFWFIQESFWVIMGSSWSITVSRIPRMFHSVKIQCMSRLLVHLHIWLVWIWMTQLSQVCWPGLDVAWRGPWPGPGLSHNLIGGDGWWCTGVPESESGIWGRPICPRTTRNPRTQTASPEECGPGEKLYIWIFL